MADSPSLQRMLSRVEALRTNTSQQRWIYVVAAAGFVIGLLVTISSVDLDLTQVALPSLIVLIVFAVPAMTASNALEYRIAARLAGRVVRLGDAVRIAVLSTAANLLPLPGGPLVRMKGLVDEGVRGVSAVAVTALMALAWLSVSTLMAGLLGGLAFGPASLAIALGAVGIIVVSGALRRRLGRQGWRGSLGTVLGVELMATLVTAARLWLAAHALGIPVGSGAFVLGLSPVLGAIVFVVPAGLGVRELFAALAAPVIGLSPAEGFLISSLDRLAGLVVHGSAALILAATASRVTPRGTV